MKYASRHLGFLTNQSSWHILLKSVRCWPYQNHCTCSMYYVDWIKIIFINVLNCSCCIANTLLHGLLNDLYANIYTNWHILNSCSSSWIVKPSIIFTYTFQFHFMKMIHQCIYIQSNLFLNQLSHPPLEPGGVTSNPDVILLWIFFLFFFFF